MEKKPAYSSVDIYKMFKEVFPPNGTKSLASNFALTIRDFAKELKKNRIINGTRSSTSGKPYVFDSDNTTKLLNSLERELNEKRKRILNLGIDLAMIDQVRKFINESESDT